MQFAAIDGHVRDARTRQPLPLVRIELSHLGVAAAVQYTDAEGHFHFGNLIPENYVISAASLGYESNTIAVNPRMDDAVAIELNRTSDHTEGVPPVISLREYMVPRTARLEFNKARKEMKRHDCAKAVTHLENGLHLVEEVSALNDLGNCYIQLGDWKNAEVSLKHATKLSDSVYIAMNLAELYARQNRFNEAEAVLHVAIRKNPNSGDGYYGLAVMYFKEGRMDEAIAAAFHAESRPHRIADLHLLLAKIYARTNPRNVAEQLELYLKEAPDAPQSDRVREALKGRR